MQELSRSVRIRSSAAAALACVLCASAPCNALITRRAIPCDFPDEPLFPERPVCPPTTLTEADARQLAWRFAPEMRFHPLEDSYLVDPADWFADAVITGPEALFSSTEQKTCDATTGTCVAPTAAWAELQGAPEWNLSSSTDFKGNASVTVLQNPALSLERKRELIAGAAFDGAGRSTANMTYSFFSEQGGNAWVFNYNAFYGWNGCSNQAFALPVFRTFVDVAEYYLCPIGVHEFDLERVSVYVCPADLEAAAAGALAPTVAETQAAVKRAQFSQHSWLDELDCTTGECPFEAGALSGSGLVAYSGLFSHAFYQRASRLWVYAAGDIGALNLPPFLENAVNAALGEPGQDGIFIADRTAGSAELGRRWVPSPANLRFLPPVATIAPGSADSWAAFPGSWGIDQLTANPADFSVACVGGLRSAEEGATEQGRCSRFSSAAQTVKAVTRARDISSTLDSSPGIDLAAAQTVPQPRTSGRTGPLFRDFATLWEPEEGAIIWTQDEPPDLKCPADPEG